MENAGAKTLNDAKSNPTTTDPCLDFFFQGAAMRNQTPGFMVGKFLAAFKEDRTKALRILGWIYDCRGGAGERDVFFHIFEFLSRNYGRIAADHLDLIPEYGRWDMLVRLLAGDIKELVRDRILAIIRMQLETDWENYEKGRPISLCAKWMPREGKRNEEMVKPIRQEMGLTPKGYRKTLSALTSYLDVVEQKMCRKDWHLINYQAVPSKAAMIYREAFNRHDQDRYQDFLKAVKEGRAEIKAGQLYPYDIVRKYMKEQDYSETLELQWENLSEIFNEGSRKSILPVVDTSGSMEVGETIKPIHVSVSLGLFLAERNPSVWGNHFITFSDNPTLQKVRGFILKEKVNNLKRANWSLNTNFQEVFQLILRTALDYKLSNDDLPQMVVVISDMEFDKAEPTNRKTNLELVKEQFQEFGYDLPTLVFWNVDSKTSQFPAVEQDENVVMISGFSHNIFKRVVEGSDLSPRSIMDEIINSPRYQRWGLTDRAG
jgi:hypothetical protein